MDLFEYALRAYNVLLDLVLLILGVFVGPLRFVVIGGLVVLIGLAIFGYLTLRKRRRARGR